MSTKETFLDEVKERILFALASEPLNSRELETRLGYSYPTVRRAITEMLDEGRVVKFDRRARNGRYVPGKDGTVVAHKVPTVLYKNTEVKLVDLHLQSGLDVTAQNQADRILKAWTTIATTARRASEGVATSALQGKLNREKVELATARINLEHMVFLINQMLDNPKLWEMDHLTNFPEDPDWPEFLERLDELYAHYYKE